MPVYLVSAETGFLHGDGQQYRSHKGLREFFRLALRQPGEHKDEEVLEVWLQVLPAMQKKAKRQ